MSESNKNYDPNKNYNWKNEEVFSMSGAEFGTILNSIRAFLSTEEARKVMIIQQAGAAIEAVLARGVTNGIVKEVEEKPSETTPTTT